MVLKLYSFSKKHNSTKQLTDETPLYTFDNVYLKQATDWDSPTLLLSENPMLANYAYLPESNRYYFIRKIRYGSNNIYEVDCELDVLATFKTEILAQELFIKYSTSNYNRWLRDDRIIPQIKNSEYISTHSVITINGIPVFSASENETVILTTVSSNYGLGFYVTDENGVDYIMECMSNNDSIFDNLTKQFSDAMGGFIQAIRLPIAQSLLDLTEDRPVSVGKYEIDAGGGNIVERPMTYKKHIYATGSIGIPVTYTDFRFTEPYCKATLSLPFIGAIDFPLSALAPEGGIGWRMDLELTTGVVTYTLYSDSLSKTIASYSGNCGGLIPLASTQIANTANAVQGILSGAISAGASMVSGAPVQALATTGISAVTGAFFGLSQEKNTVIGSYSGGRSEFASSIIKLTVQKFASGNEPANIAPIEGRPLCKVDVLTNYMGYLQTVGAQVDIACTEETKLKINAMLDSGIFIE